MNNRRLIIIAKLFVLVTLLLVFRAYFILIYKNKLSLQNVVNSSHTDNIPYSTGLKYDLKEIEGGRGALMYSAYLDSRPHGITIIKIISIVNKQTGNNVFECTHWSASNQTTTSTATVTVLPDHGDHEYSAAYITCPVPKLAPEDRVKRVFLSAVPGKSKNYVSSVPVEDLQNRTYFGEINMCVRPVHKHYDKTTELVEFIEMHKLLGVDHFIIYNTTIGPNVEKILQNYIQIGTVEVLPWILPKFKDGGVHAFGQMGALNDCMLRSVGRFGLVGNFDLDEFPIPRQHDTILQLIKTKRLSYEYMFLNAFFYLSWENDTSRSNSLNGDGHDVVASVQVPHLRTQLKTRRLATVDSPTERSKYFARPEAVLIAGIHIVRVFFDDRIPNTAVIETSEGLSHHYRHVPDDKTQKELSAPSMIDRSAHRYGLRLTKVVHRACSNIFPNLTGCL